MFASFEAGVEALRSARCRRARRPTSPGSPTRPRRARRWRWPGTDRGRATAVRALPAARAASTAAAWRSSAGRAPRSAVRAPPRGHDRASCARAAAPSSAQRAGRAWQRGALPRALPARRPARPRRVGRDARDRHDVGGPAGRSTARSRAALARRTRRCVALPRLAPLPDGRLAVLHLPRPRAPGGRDRPVARGQAGGAATRSWPRAATITHHHAVGADHRPWMARRGRRRGPRARCGPSRRSWTRRAS